MNHQLVAVVALIDLDSRVLVSQRSSNKIYGGYWEFPGGKVEENETPDIAAVRELKEELNIHTWTNCLTPLTFTNHVYEKVNHIILLYVCRKWEGLPSSDQENRLQWISPKDLNQLPTLPANSGMIAILRDWL